MAGYSGTPLAKKLGIKPGTCVVLLSAPDGFADTLAGLPDDATIHTRLTKTPADVIVLFTPTSKALNAAFAKCHKALAQDGGFWVAWPKKSSGVPTDLTENTIRDIALAAGLVDNKVCAIDETWSGLRLVIRVKDRRPDPPRSRQSESGGARRGSLE